MHVAAAAGETNLFDFILLPITGRCCHLHGFHQNLFSLLSDFDLRLILAYWGCKINSRPKSFSAGQWTQVGHFGLLVFLAYWKIE